MFAELLNFQFEFGPQFCNSGFTGFSTEQHNFRKDFYILSLSRYERAVTYH